MSNAVIILVCAFLCSGALTALPTLGKLEEASMQIDSKPLIKVGPSACTKVGEAQVTEDTEVTITGLSSMLWQNYKGEKLRAISIGNENEKQVCPKLTQVPAGMVDFPENPSVIKQKDLIFNSNACSKEGGIGIRKLCIYPPQLKGDDAIAEIKYSYDTRTAQIKDITDVVVANGSIKFFVKVSGPATKMLVCFGQASSDKPAEEKCPDGWEPKEQSPGDVVLKDLDRNQTYKVKVKLLNTSKKESWVYVKDDGNAELSPIPIAGPLDTYDGQGGLLMYSCDSSPNASNFSLLVFITALLIFIRNRSKLSNIKKPLLMLPLLFIIPVKESRAEFGATSVGILGSMYRPNLDSEKGANNFYKCHFSGKNKQDGPINPLLGFDVNWHLWDGLRLGLGVGYTYVSGMGLEVDAQNRPLCDKPRKNNPVSLHMYQIRPQITYEADHFVEYFPIFPYIRAGLIGQGYHIFNGENAAKEKKNSAGKVIKNNGFVFGWQAAVGLKMRLDFMEPGAVRAAQSGGFFDHIYLMGQLSYEKIDNFGKGGFNFSPKDVMGTKLPLMWTFGLVFDLL